MWRLLPVFFVALISTRAAAAPEVGGELRMQLHFGGDSIATVGYSDGSESDLDAGDYLTFGAGVTLIPVRVQDHALELGLFAGVGSWSTGPENTDDRLQLFRFPVELLAGWRINFPHESLALRVAAGLEYQFVTGVRGTGSLEGEVDLDLDDALGWVAEVRANWELLALGLRYTRMSYEAPAHGVAFDASSIGVVVGLVFPPAGGF